MALKETLENRFELKRRARIIGRAMMEQLWAAESLDRVSVYPDAPSIGLMPCGPFSSDCGADFLFIMGAAHPFLPADFIPIDGRT